MTLTTAARPDLTLDRLIADFDAGRPVALARAVSIVENRRPEADQLLARLHPRLGRARRVGVTGPPGAGKSTLVTALVTAYRAAGLTVGVVAVDPTSPFTGGALLGDRIRMEAIALDPGVFIRSMATRGSLGGLAAATRDTADVMDAFGMQRVIVETVGVGQSELDVARMADSTIVVLVPESGDSIQTLKAGLMEIADIFVVNKADRPGADRLRKEIGLMLGFGAKAVQPADAADAVRHDESRWTPPVLLTVAVTGEGVSELVAALDQHLLALEANGGLAERRRQQLRERVVEVVERSIRARLWSDSGTSQWLDARLPELLSGATNPFAVASELLARYGTFPMGPPE